MRLHFKAEFLSAETHVLFKCNGKVLHMWYRDCTFRLSGYMHNSLICKAQFAANTHAN